MCSQAGPRRDREAAALGGAPSPHSTHCLRPHEPHDLAGDAQTTLKCAKEGGYELDMTSTRYKTARFCAWQPRTGVVCPRSEARVHPVLADGPTISSLSGMLNEPLRLYLTELEYNSVATDTPYLWYPTQSGDTTRCLGSSQWSQLVSRVLKKYTGKAAPPKLLRGESAPFPLRARGAHARVMRAHQPRSSRGSATLPMRQR